MNKSDLAKKILALEGLSDEDKSALLGLLRGQKKYGLVWEDKPEAVEKRLETELPVLREVTDRAIISDNSDAPNHILIEGDNLEALTCLSYTHAGKIDVIYIDPPYNTGNRDFIYNDQFIDKDDTFRHSKWLSFINKRLRIAKRLMSDRAVIFISIDDNEQAQLKILCDEIFGSSNCVGTIPTIMNLKGNQSEYGFAGTHEYTIVYTKNKQICVLGNLVAPDEDLDSWKEDEIGFFKKGATLKRTGTDAPRASRPFGYFPILVNDVTQNAASITEEEYKHIYNPSNKTFDDDYIDYLRVKYKKSGYTLLLPIVNGLKCSWRWGFNTVKSNLKEIIVTYVGEDYSLYKKQRPELGELPSRKPKSILYKAQYSSGNGTSQLKDLAMDNCFTNPKPIDLIIDLLRIGNCKDSTVLDFFAGSGTTLHATMQLNAEDGGKRTCILCTNNENGICENVTYERNRRVIRGYTTPKGEHVAGLTDNSLRYYRTEFVGRRRTPANLRRLVKLSTDMLCIKEDLYHEQETFAGVTVLPQVYRFFSNGRDKNMLIIYREEYVSVMAKLIARTNYDTKIKVYVFSPSEDPWTGEFADVAEKTDLCALPAAILNAYRRVLPKAKDNEMRVENEDYKMEETLDGLFAAEEGGNA